MDDVLEQIKELAVDVYEKLGVGHLEAPYQKAMEVGLRLRGLKFDAQRVVEIMYAGHFVGYCILDLLVDGRILIELKSITCLGEPDRLQLIKYMQLADIATGVLINFPQLGRSKGSLIAEVPEIEVLGDHGDDVR